MSETAFFNCLVWAWLAMALFTFVLLFFIKAPYGRYTRRGWGPIIDRRTGWIIMETPSLVFFVMFFVLGNRHSDSVAIVFLSLWIVHYFHRSFIYPFQTRGALKTQTLVPVALAVVFNLGNAYINGRWLFSISPGYGPAWLSDPRFFIGIVMFVSGFAICKHSDHILRNLRRPGEGGYKIPTGGMFRLVSCPNYLGEIIEWSGWAVATWSLAGLSFAAWTFANLVPRAWSHHRWYRQKFPDYPPKRRAIFPFILSLALLMIVAYPQASDAAEPQDELEEEFELLHEDEIVYTASKHAQDISESPSAITVITREQIENTHCSDIVCLLRQVPEVEVRRVLPMYHSVGARALAGELGDKVLVLVDGREINNELFGIVYWAGMPVHLQEIERIEVIRGPGSALYGANAHSMVVSITTVKPDSDQAQAYIGIGEHGRESDHLRIDKLLGDWRLSLSGSREIANNWRIQDKREREVYNVRFRLEHAGESSSTSLDMGLVDGEGEFSAGFATCKWDNVYIAHAVLDHSRDWLKARATFNLMYGSLEPLVKLDYHGIVLGYPPDSVTYNNPSLDAELQTNWAPFKGNMLIAGANYRWIAMYSDLNVPDQENQHRLGLFVQDEQRLFDQLTLNGGLRLDYNSITPLTVSPRLAVVWRPVQSQLARVAFGRAFRKPSFMNTSFHFLGFKGTSAFPELGDFFKNNFGNSDLGNESITVFEAGYRGRFLDGDLTAEADAFFNMYRDTIVFNTEIELTSLGVPDLTRSKMRFENNGREVNSAGGSISLVYWIKEKLRLYLNYTYRYSWYISSSSEGSAAGLGKKGDRVLWEPAHMANAGFHYLFDCGLRLGAQAHFHSARDNTQNENGDLFSDLILLHNPAHVIYNAFVSFRLTTNRGWVEAGVRAFDIFNEGFRDSVAVQATDGSEVGGELIGRRVLLFVRGSL